MKAGNNWSEISAATELENYRRWGYYNSCVHFLVGVRITVPVHETQLLCKIGSDLLIETRITPKEIALVV